jgi:hypothetical protein
MWKWILALVAAVVVGAFVMWQRNSVKSSYVNGLPEYNRLPNQQFLFESDCYVFKFKNRQTDWPLVGTRAVVPELPAEVDEKNLGANYPSVRLLDVVRAGAAFKLVSVRRDEGRNGTHITFEILFLDEADRKYPRLDAFYLLDHTPEKNDAPPVFLERLVVPRVRK